MGEEAAGTGTVLEIVKPGSTTDHTDVTMTETVPSSMHEDLAIVTSAQSISLEPQLEVTNESGINDTEGNEQDKKEDYEINEDEEDKKCEVEGGDVEIVDNVDKSDKDEKDEDKGVELNGKKGYDELENIFKEDENDKEERIVEINGKKEDDNVKINDKNDKEDERDIEIIDNIDKNDKEEDIKANDKKDKNNDEDDYEEEDDDDDKNDDDEDYEEEDDDEDKDDDNLDDHDDENVKILSRSKSPKGKHICEICGKECPSRSKLLDHKVSHFDAKPFKCTIDGCQSSFKRKRQLDSHVNAFHFGVRPYECTEAGCTCAFFTTSALKTHMKMHARSLACPYEGCGATFHKKTQLRAHMSAEHTKNPGKPYSCSTCGKSFSYPSQLERHEVKHATIDHLCAYDDCGFVAPTFKELREHINMYHLNVHGENVRCPECGKEVTRAWYPQHLKKHSTKTLQSFQCTVPGCTKVYNSKKSLRAHLNASHSDHKVVCPVCSAEFAYKVSMVKHVKRVHQEFDVSSLSPQPSSLSSSSRLGVKRDAIIARAASCDSIAVEAKRFCASSSNDPVNDSTNVSSSSGMITITSTSNTNFHNTNNTNFNDGINFSMNDSTNETNTSIINKPNGPSPNTNNSSTNSIACKISGISQKRALIISQ